MDYIQFCYMLQRLDKWPMKALGTEKFIICKKVKQVLIIDLLNVYHVHSTVSQGYKSSSDLPSRVCLVCLCVCVCPSTLRLGD